MLVEARALDRHAAAGLAKLADAAADSYPMYAEALAANEEQIVHELNDESLLVTAQSATVSA